MNSSRNNLTSLRGLMAVMIFLHHALPQAGIPYGYDFGNVGVLFFFVMSGFALTATYKDRINAADFTFRTFIVKRCAKVFPIQWLTLGIIILFLDDSVQWPVVFSHFTLSQSFIPFWRFYRGLNGAAWFLSSLLCSYFLFPLLLKIMLRYRKYAFAVYLTGVMGWMTFLVLLPERIGRDWLGYYNPFARVLDFALGMWLALQTDCIQKRVVNLSRTGATLLEVTTIACFIWRIVKVCWFSNLYVPIAYGYPVTCLLIGVFASECRGWISWLLNRPWMVWLGDISLGIYMWQFLFMPWIEQSNLPVAVILTVSFTMLVLLGWITQKTFIPWSTKWFTRGMNKLWPAREKSV